MQADDETRRSLQVRSILRLFRDEAPPDDAEEIFAQAATFEILLEDRSNDDDVSTAARNATADDHAHALCDCFDLVTDPAIVKRPIALLAARLFTFSGYDAKAATLLRTYDYGGPPELDLYSILAATARGIAGRDVKILRETSDTTIRFLELDKFGSTAKLVYTTRLLIDSLIRSIDLNGDTAEALRVSAARARLVQEISYRLGDSQAVDLSERILNATNTLATTSLLRIIRERKIEIDSDLLARFVSDEIDPVLSLWPPQIRAIEHGGLNRSFVAALPTSSGKTLLAELRVAKYFTERRDGFVVYVAPYNALASQVHEQLTRRFEGTSVGPAMLWTGSFEIGTEPSLDRRILVTTPEKLDAIVRLANLGHARFHALLEKLGLLILDECHLVGSGQRGLALELLLARLKRRYDNLPILALSAVTSSTEELSQWLTESPRRFVKDEWRPTRRQLVIYRKNGRLELLPNGELVAELLTWEQNGDAAADLALSMHERGGSPLLILCTQRSLAESVAQRVAKLAKKNFLLADPHGARESAAREIEEYYGKGSFIAQMIRIGVAIHHAGLSTELRTLTELLIRQGLIAITCATTTLAEGVHLPFRSLIVPYYHFGHFETISPNQTQNIVGRAGRAYSNVKSTIVFLEPAPSFRLPVEQMLKTIDTPRAIQSQLVKLNAHEWLGIDKSSSLNFLKIESQVLGAISDGGYSENLADELIQDTLATQMGEATHVARDAILASLSKFETSNHAVASHQSPWRLTAYGMAAALSGLSLHSFERIHEFIHNLPAEDVWFSLDEWLSIPISSDLIARIAQLSVASFEYLERAISVSSSEDIFLAAMRNTRSSNSVSDIFAATSFDQHIISGWVSGLTMGELAESLHTTYKRRGPLHVRKEQRANSLLQFLDERKIPMAWTLSAAIRASDLICADRQLSPPPYTASVRLLDAGVSSIRATTLIRAGVERTTAVAIAPRLHRPPSEFESDLRATIAYSLQQVPNFTEGLSEFETIRLYSLVGLTKSVRHH